MKEIPLTQGKVAIVDDDMYDWLSQFKWHYSAGYAASKDHRLIENRFSNKVYMHRLIMNTPDEMQVDHVDRNGLHNWRENLRNCTHAQNNLNRSKSSGTSRYKGVSWRKRDKTWYAQIRKDGSFHWLGDFDTEEDAAIAYNHAALEFFGPFANFNDIPEWLSKSPVRREMARFRGFSFHKRIGKWQAYLKVQGRRVHLGYFVTHEEAVRAIETYKQTSPTA